MIELSVVLITRNQDWNVDQLIESIFEKASPFLSIEVILVDSASTDKTVELASKYPITVIRLHPDQRLTAAAGRYIGDKHASGAFSLFLDGDMELVDGWLEAALHYLIDNPTTIAAVTGQVIDLSIATHSLPKRLTLQPKHPVSITDVKHGGGAAIYRRSILKEVGTFNPYIYSDEEPELCARIRRKGYRIVQVNCPIALHYTDPSDRITTLLARRKRRLYLGAGQNLRYHLGDDVFWLYLKERGFGFAPASAIAAWFGSIALLWGKGRRLWLYITLSIPAVVVGVTAVRKRSLYRSLYSMMLRLMIMDGTLRGFVLKPLYPEINPLKFDVVRTPNSKGA